MYQFLLNNRRIILFLSLLGIIAGYFSYREMPIKMYPSINRPQIYVQISHPSYTAVDFSDGYGSLIETRANSIEDVVMVETSISNRWTQIRIEFDYGVDSEEAFKRVQTAFDTLKSSLPSESEDYGMGWNEESLNEMNIVLYSSQIDERELYQIARPVILDHLNRVTEAEYVYVLPVEELQANLTFKPDALFSYNLAPDTVVNAIRNGYKNISIGSMWSSTGMISLRIRRDIDTLYDIENIRIADVGGKVIQLRDVAEVNVNYGLAWSIFQLNGNRSVAVSVGPKVDGNLVTLSQDIRKALDNALKELPDHISYEVVIDPATFITRSINNVVQSAVLGALLAFFSIILLMGELKNSLIIGISIPLSVIFAFIPMYFLDISINLISLSGLALAVGMIVDASIVAMENIFRHREEVFEQRGMIEDYKTLVAMATKEVGASVIGSTITSVCVFVPLSFTSPLTANILGDIAWTVVCTLSCSLIVALFVIPLVAYYVYRKKKTAPLADKINRFKRFSTALTNVIYRGYEKLLKFIIYSKVKSLLFIVVSIAALLFCLIFLAPNITREIIAKPQGNMVTMTISNRDITNQEEMLLAVRPIEQDIMNNYKGIVKVVFSQVRRRNASIIAELYSSSMVPAVIDSLTAKYPGEGNWNYDISSWDPSEMPLPETYALHVRVEGPKREDIFAIMDRIVDILRREDMYGYTYTRPFTALASEIAMYPRYETLAAMPEFTLNRLTTLIQYLLNGANVITIKTEDDEERDITIEYPDDTITSLKDLQDHLVPYNNKSIPLKHFFEFFETTGINQLHLTEGKETFNIYAGLKMETPAWQQAELERRSRELITAEIELPPGYRIVFEDTQKIINDAIFSLIIALALSIFLIYIVLGIQFNSTRIPMIILVTIPFGFIGVILSLFVFKSTISLNSMLGAVLLCGIVVNNAIIIIDFYLTAAGHFSDRREAIIHAVKLRFRPILITTLTTILGMLPIAFAIGDGANIIQPLGIAVSGGLTFSTFFTLFMVPVILNFIGPIRRGN